MLKFLIKIFAPWGNGKSQGFLSLSVIAVLALGIGVFWSIQVIFSNYYTGLISKVLQVKEEISINKANLEIIDTMIKYDVVSKKTVEQLVVLDKLKKVKGLDKVLEKYE